MKDDELMHYGVKGMKWGVRKDPRANSSAYDQSKKQWTKEPEGGSIRRQSNVERAKTRAERRAANKELKQGYKEYRAFEKDMHKKYGSVKKYTLNPETKKYEDGKTNKQIEKWEHNGLDAYELHKNVKTYNMKKYVAKGASAVGTALIIYGAIRL